MIVSHATENEILEAARAASKEFDNNVLLYKLEPMSGSGLRWKVRLTVNDSRGKGAKIGHNGRAVKAACVHAHAEFLLALPIVCKVKTLLTPYTIAMVGGPMTIPEFVGLRLTLHDNHYGAKGCKCGE